MKGEDIEIEMLNIRTRSRKRTWMGRDEIIAKKAKQANRGPTGLERWKRRRNCEHTKRHFATPKATTTVRTMVCY